MHGVLALFAVCAGLAAPSLSPGLGAQQVAGATPGGSVLNLLPVGERAARTPSELLGELGAHDLLVPGGQRVQAWLLEAQEGEAIRIDLTSNDFDAYLYVVGPGLGEGLSDDDGGSGLNSRLCVVLPATGRYRVVAGSLGGGTGRYSLSLADDADHTEGASGRDGGAAGSCGDDGGGSEIADLDATEPRGSLVPEVEAHGSLGADDPRHPDRGAPMAVWTLEGEAGRHLSVDLVSEDFDAYLYLSGPGLAEVLSNDDGAGCLDARIAVTFPESGTYRIVATGFEESARGAYRLIATSEPEEDRACATPGSAGTVSNDILEGVTVPDGRIVPRPEVPTPAPRAGGTASQLAGLELGGRLVDGDAELGEGRPAQGWGLRALEGDRFVIELLSGDFDANLYLDGPGLTEAFYDDDGAGGLDSRLDVTVPADGLFRIVVTSNSGGEGAYTLRILRRVGRD
jgi:hypothetical protein